jgi:hypothetical protein
MIQKKSGVEVIGQIDPKRVTIFLNTEKLALRLFCPLVLPAASGLALAKLGIDLMRGNAEGFADLLQTRLQPHSMHVIVHSMSSLVFGHIEFIGIAVDAKGELRQVVIVQTVASNASLSGLFVYMPV